MRLQGQLVSRPPPRGPPWAPMLPVLGPELATQTGGRPQAIFPLELPGIVLAWSWPICVPPRNEHSRPACARRDDPTAWSGPTVPLGRFEPPHPCAHKGRQTLQVHSATDASDRCAKRGLNQRRHPRDRTSGRGIRAGACRSRRSRRCLCGARRPPTRVAEQARCSPAAVAPHRVQRRSDPD